MSETEESLRNCISEQLEAILARLSTDQIRYVVARQEFATDKEAAEEVGISPRTVYSWGNDVREAVRMMAVDGLVTAQHIRRRNLAKAMLIKVKGLDSDDDVLRQKVATEIIEWEMGKARQTNELTGADGGPIRTEDVSETRARLLADIERRLEQAAARGTEGAA